MQVQKEFVQKHPFPASQVFPLLCPVREKDWLEGWNYRMIHSQSGLAEMGCVFSTSHHGVGETYWMVIHYNPDNYEIGFVRCTPGKNLVRIDIHLKNTSPHSSNTYLTYAYTPLSQEESSLLEEGLDARFEDDMRFWENAINYYLQTGKMLKS